MELFVAFSAFRAGDSALKIVQDGDEIREEGGDREFLGLLFLPEHALPEIDLVGELPEILFVELGHLGSKRGDFLASGLEFRRNGGDIGRGL